MFGGGEQGLFSDLDLVSHGVISGQSEVFDGGGGASATNLVKVAEEEDVVGNGILGKE